MIKCPRDDLSKLLAAISIVFSQNRTTRKTKQKHLSCSYKTVIMISVKIFFLLLSVIYPATMAIREEHQVVMIAAHQSQCTHGESSCSQEIKQFIAEYYSSPEDSENHVRGRELQFQCDANGFCDDSAPEFWVCVFLGGCNGGGRRELAGRNAQEVNPLEFLRQTENNCYLAGHLDDQVFTNDIIAELGGHCPCVEETHFYVRICEYPE